MTTGIDDHNFIPYPDIDDKDFYQVLYSKKEFNKTAYGSDFRYKTTEELCSRGEFKMQNHQEFIRNFISPETPYNGALLFHGTGVGKTCAAIGTTEGLRDYVKRDGKIYILSSENIRPNFYKELYDPNRGSFMECLVVTNVPVIVTTHLEFLMRLGPQRLTP